MTWNYRCNCNKWDSFTSDLDQQTASDPRVEDGGATPAASTRLQKHWRELDAWSFHREQSSSDIKGTPSNTKDYPIQASSQNQTPLPSPNVTLWQSARTANSKDEPMRILCSRLRQLQTTLQPFNLFTDFTFLSATSLECRGIKLKGDVNMVLKF